MQKQNNLSKHIPISILIESTVGEWQDMSFEGLVKREVLELFRFDFLNEFLDFKSENVNKNRVKLFSYLNCGFKLKDRKEFLTFDQSFDLRLFAWCDHWLFHHNFVDELIHVYPEFIFIQHKRFDVIMGRSKREGESVALEGERVHRLISLVY